MEKIDIFEFRTSIQKRISSEIPNIDLISNKLIRKGLVKKQFGLCAEPFDKYFEICNTDNRGVSCVKAPLNTIHVVVNYNTSTRKKRIYYYSVQINYINGFYYFCCLAQSAFYKKSIGAEHTVYKVNENDVSTVIDEIFNYVEV
jgi:hypothetical protein